MAMQVAFHERGNVRIEVERAPHPFTGWWRARVVGGRTWSVPSALPWSYGATDAGAVDAALTLWIHAGKPGH
jgi:hypothetical protein